MPTNVHSTALIAPGSELGSNVTVGPYAIIDEHTKLGDDCIIDAHARIMNYTTLGARNHIHQGAVLGEIPQDAKFAGEVSYLSLGDDNHVREYSTIHRASGEGEATRVGSEGLFMAYSHIGHNSQVGDEVLMASYTGISGHCVVEDYVNIAGLVGVHQYLTIGTMAMIGGHSRVVMDVPPYTMSQGNPSKLYGLNFRGLIRRGIVDDRRTMLKKAYRMLYRKHEPLEEVAAKIKAELTVTPEIERLLAFQEAVGRGYGGRQRDPRGQQT